jgi:hypothetical protein
MGIVTEPGKNGANIDDVHLRRNSWKKKDLFISQTRAKSPNAPQ